MANCSVKRWMGVTMLFFRTRGGSIIAGILVVAITWLVQAPKLLHWVNVGAMSAMSFLLVVCAVVSLLVGALSVWRAKRGVVPFSLHIVFAALACVTTHFLFVIPLALGVLVAIGALLWPARAQHDVQGRSGAESI